MLYSEAENYARQVMTGLAAKAGRKPSDGLPAGHLMHISQEFHHFTFRNESIHPPRLVNDLIEFDQEELLEHYSKRAVDGPLFVAVEKFRQSL